MACQNITPSDIDVAGTSGRSSGQCRLNAQRQRMSMGEWDWGGLARFVEVNMQISGDSVAPEFFWSIHSLPWMDKFVQDICLDYLHIEWPPK